MNKKIIHVALVAILLVINFVPELIFASQFSFNAVILPHHQVEVPKLMTISEILDLKHADMKGLLGHKPAYLDKMVLDEMQHQFRREIRKKRLDPQKEIQFIEKFDELTKGFNATGFFLGLLLNIYGVIGAYLFSKDKNLIRWAWRGFFAFVAAVFLLGGLFAFLSLPG